MFQIKEMASVKILFVASSHEEAQRESGREKNWG
jgi:hypothetical protein